MAITCGIDWAETHYDVALVEESGKLAAKRRISDDAEGYRRLLELLAEAGDTAQDPIPVAVETARGLLISCLRTTGRAVYSINPMAWPAIASGTGHAGQVRSRGRDGAGEHPAHRRRHAPAAAGRLGTEPRWAMPPTNVDAISSRTSGTSEAEPPPG